MKTVTLLLVSLVVAATPVRAQDETAVAAAEQATRAWLGLTDSGKYEESWAQAGSLFRAAISAEDWVQALTGARTAFGAMLSRDTASAEYSTTLPGAPDGEYIVFQFNSAFANKAAAVETVTAMKDPDGKWRVAGYYIR